MKRLAERYEQFLRIDADGPAETLMRMRAVWIIGFMFVGTQLANLAVLSLNYRGWTYDHTITVLACVAVVGLVQIVRWYKNVAFYAAAYSAFMLAGTLASALPDHGGVNTALLPFIAIGPIMTGFMAGRRAAFTFYVVSLWLLVGLFAVSLTHPPIMISGDYARETNRFFQTVFALSLSTLMSTMVTEQVYSSLAALRVSAERAKRAEAAKSEFLATMSHELRTPLNGVIGLTDALINGALPARERALAETIRKSGESLLLILNDLLDLSKIEAGKLSIEARPASPAELVRSVADGWRETAAVKDLFLTASIEGDVPDLIEIDDLRVRQILQNLVSNAIKFTSVGGVALRLRGVRDPSVNGAYRLEFRVSDTGRGVPPDMIERIFDPFEQGERGTTRAFGGTGLGLPISRMLTTLLGGDIRIEETSPAGTTCLVALPVRALTTATSESAAPSAPEEFSLAGLRVLVAEDNEVNRLVVNEFFKSWGVAADFVEDGAACVERVRAARYDVILMDKHMPIMNGIDAARAIRAGAGPGAETPIIAVTADAMAGERELLLAAGMNDFISKPLRASALKQVIIRTLNIAKAA